MLSNANREWLAKFSSKFGRPPRILHIGNVANNAYKNAKLLNAAGVDCDVICYDYYHLMGCPEWEEADFNEPIADQFKPDWAAVDLGGYVRPKWFAQGPLEDCIEYLVARRKGMEKRAKKLWRRLEVTNSTFTGIKLFALAEYFRLALNRTSRKLNPIFYEPDAIGRLARSAERGWIARHCKTDTARLAVISALLALIVLWRVARVLFVRKRAATDASARVDDFGTSIIQQFQVNFPDRRDKLVGADLVRYKSIPDIWRNLLDEYDLVQAYATDPIIPMLAGKRPYIAFEHGTLRDFTLSDNSVSRLNSLAYNQADHVFITNGDCLDYARKIGVTRYTPMLHPIDEVAVRSMPPMSLDPRTEFGVRYAFLCTLRHDWSVKGTDKYIRALSGIARAIGGDFVLLMTKWGAELDASMRLAKELGVFDKIKWIDPLPRHALARMQKSVDILFDQIALPHFGGTAPEGIAAGVPVIMSYDPKSTEWIVAEPAPILSAWNVEEIVKNVRIAIDPEWLVVYRREAAEWIDRYHSSSIILQRHLDVYAKLLAPRGTDTVERPMEGHV